MQPKMHGKDREGKRHQKRSSGDSPAIYWHLETATEFLIYTILVFTAWAFGTTERWSINTVNALNYVLGGLLLLKSLVRATTGFKPARWDHVKTSSAWNPAWITAPMFCLTVVMLGYCAVSAWNARADFIRLEQRFEYFATYKPWLPHSYDQSATWQAFRLYVAAACFFWALRDWLITKTNREMFAGDEHRWPIFVGPGMARSSIDETNRTHFPSRLQRLLWVIIVNAAILAFEGTIQRLSGTRDLLWLVRPLWNDIATAQFGPFNYRSNGAQYLNMIWPLSLAFWWGLHRRRNKLGAGAEFLLLPFTGLILAGPIIAMSRGGIAIAIGQVLAGMAILAYAFRKTAWKVVPVAVALIVIVGLAAWLQWDVLRQRLNENTFNTLGGRTEIYQDARKIADDFPVWGTGPGTFSAVYQLYREDPQQVWYVHAHDDFLQTVITFGRIGFAILLLMLLLVGSYWFVARGIPTAVFFVSFVWVAIGGCFVHASFDFPLQVYSLFLMILTLCAILMVTGRR